MAEEYSLFDEPNFTEALTGSSKIVWVCNKCWHSKECLTLGRGFNGTDTCDLCGEPINPDNSHPIRFKTYVRWAAKNMRKIMDALRVLDWDKTTRSYLKLRDPKALEQADAALKKANEDPACGWDTLAAEPPMTTVSKGRDVIQECSGNLEVPEIRVWAHGRGGDSYRTFKTFEAAMKFLKTHDQAEGNPLLAFRGWEINLWTLDPPERRK